MDRPSTANSSTTVKPESDSDPIASTSASTSTSTSNTTTTTTTTSQSRPTAAQPSLIGSERDLKAKSLRDLAHSNPIHPPATMGYESGTDTETESNLSRPPSPDKHRYPKHRLSGLQAKDSHVVKHEKSLDGSLALTRETSPSPWIDETTAANAAEGAANNALHGHSHQLTDGLPGAEKAAELALRNGGDPLPEAVAALKQANSQAVAAATATNSDNQDGFKPSTSPPPRAMSPPPKGNSSTKVSSGSSIIVPSTNQSSTTTTTTPPSSSNATPPVKSAPVPVPKKEEKEKDNRGMLRRMLSSSERGRDKEAAKEKERMAIAAAANERASAIGGRGSPARRDTSASSRGSTPPASPRSELDDPSSNMGLLNAVRGMGLGASGNPGSGSASVTSPPQSQPPSRNVSLKRPEGRDGKDGKEGLISPPPEGSRLTAEALRNWDEKAREHGVPAPAPPSAWAGGVSKSTATTKEKGKDSDAKSTASSTLRDMIMGGPKISRRGSSTSQAGKSDGDGTSTKDEKKSGSNKGSNKGSTKGSTKNGGDTTSLLKKYGVCEKAAIGKGATAVVRLAHKWDRGTDKLYAVKVSFFPSSAFPFTLAQQTPRSWLTNSSYIPPAFLPLSQHPRSFENVVKMKRKKNTSRN